VERCKLSSGGVGQSPSQSRRWCILALKYYIRWWFSWGSTYQLLLKNANTIMRTASIDGFKRNWWSDKHEYHLESCNVSVHHRGQLYVRRCDKMWREAQKPENLEVWKVGASLAPSPLLPIARGTGERCKLSSGIEFAGLKTKNNQFCDTMNSIFVRQTCCVLNNFSYTAFRWGSHEDSEQRQRQFSIKSVLVQNTCWLSYTMQRCLLGASLRENFTHVHSQIQDDASEALKLPLRGNSGGR